MAAGHKFPGLEQRQTITFTSADFVVETLALPAVLIEQQVKEAEAALAGIADLRKCVVTVTVTLQPFTLPMSPTRKP